MPVLRKVLAAGHCIWTSAFVLLVDGLHELAYYQRHTLDAFDLLLCSYKLPLEVSICTRQLRSPRHLE
jgi:hypothetical protein